MKTHVLGYENPRFMIIKRRFMIRKTRFYDWERGFITF